MPVKMASDHSIPLRRGGLAVTVVTPADYPPICAYATGVAYSCAHGTECSFRWGGSPELILAPTDYLTIGP